MSTYKGVQIHQTGLRFALNDGGSRDKRDRLGNWAQSTITPQIMYPSSCVFTNLQPMRSGSTTSAGRQKRAWGRDENFLEMGLVPMGTIRKRP